MQQGNAVLLFRGIPLPGEMPNTEAKEQQQSCNPFASEIS